MKMGRSRRSSRTFVRQNTAPKCFLLWVLQLKRRGALVMSETYPVGTLRFEEGVGTVHVSVEQAYAFEPDLGNFARLADCARDMGVRTGARVSLWPCAVGERAGSMRFSGEGGEAGHLSADGDRAVTVVALDEALPTEYVTDLKMDIEGAELDALRGAARMVRRCHPRLAICVYHRAEHLWEIPLFVRDLGLGYDYLLRSHGHFGFDVVMYAVPRVGG